MNKYDNPFGLNLIDPIKPSEYMPKEKQQAPPSLPGKPKKHGITQAVVLTDIDIPFDRMVVIMLKWMIASVPAFVVAFIIFFIAGSVISAGALIALTGAGR